jgi:phasin
MATPRRPAPKLKFAPDATADVEDAGPAAADMPVETGAPAGLEPPVVSPETVAATAADMEKVMKDGAEKAMAGARDVQEQFRKAVEQGLQQSRLAYDKMRAAAEEATGSLETSYAAATRGITEFNARTIDALKSHAEANFDHLKALTAAKSFPEAISLQTAHARRQMEALTAEVSEFANLAQKVAVESAEPIKATLVKRFAA